MRKENTFQERLYHATLHEPFRRKMIIAPSYIEGQSWLMRICRDIGPVMNVEVHTIQSLVKNVVQFSLYKQGMTLIGGKRSFWVIYHVMEQMASKIDAYISVDQLKPGIVMHVHQAIMDLRNAGVTAEQLRDDHFLNLEKGRYVREVLSSYEAVLKQRNWTDFPGMLLLLTTKLSDDIELIVPEPILLPPVYLQMLERLSNGQMTRIQVDPSFFDIHTSLPTSEVQLFHATGKLAEVREVLRRIMTDRIPLDEVEIIVSNEEYALAISNMCTSMNLSCTFAEGLPLPTSRIGRTAQFLLNWLESGYQVQLLTSMLQQQLMSFSDREQEISNVDCIRILETSGIGWGKERYIKLLDPTHVFHEEHSDEQAEGSYRKEQQERERVIKQHLFNLFNDLFPDELTISSPAGIWDWLVNILDRFGVRRMEKDAIVLQEMKGTVKDLQESPVPEKMPLQQVFQYARDMLHEIRVGVQPLPKPGALYISSLASGGLSGRKSTLLLGMDEHSWSGSIRQNPMLLDEECKRISANLLTAAKRVRERQRQRDVRLGMIDGNATLSFSSYDLAEGTTISPAFQLLQIFRKVSGESNADYEKLLQCLGEPVGYLDIDKKLTDESNTLSVDGSHYVFGQIHTQASPWGDRQSFIESVYPHLRQGRIALEARASTQVTGHDGYIAGDEWSAYWRGKSERTFSSSQLEKYAACPMRYFYQNVLGIRVKDLVTFDRTSWLKPNEKGSLLHEVYRRYMTEISASNTGTVTHDHARLLRIAEETIHTYAEQIPAPSPHVFEKERKSILRDVEIFNRMEALVQSNPRFFEQELTMDGQPLRIELDDGVTILLRGIVDRIDELEPHQYRIIDYKTGSPRPYKENGMFAGGTQLQHALYAIGTELWMWHTGLDSEAKVLEAAYIFPSERGQGQVIARSQNDRQQVVEVIRRILQSMEQGLFVPTSDPGICRYCDYAAVCGDHAEKMADKRKDEGNMELLLTLLEVESID